MRIQPRTEIVRLWHALASHTYAKNNWEWGGAEGADSLGDAEQLLSLIYPAQQLASLGVDRPADTAADVLRALDVFGNSQTIPMKLVQAFLEYMRAYRAEDGSPVFSAPARLIADDAPTRDQEELDVVPSYSVSLSVALSALGFIRSFRRQMQRKEANGAVDELEDLASARLTAAMVD
ncbi:hypothetical protein [Cryptosporangium phraense]|uniref:Uncharacterized protein n=1 Tax=Cryptosporangium phraense TaxID=2593070 RepID=A0A545AL79_9ACTN|nr:hypothetical protein [Cryptosporangium phraense]TQS42079.1 hypothetical protein FL583_26190 [Cryptosporangium phraense]